MCSGPSTKGAGPANTSALARCDPFQTSHLQNFQMIKGGGCSRPLGSWEFVTAATRNSHGAGGEAGGSSTRGQDTPRDTHCRDVGSDYPQVLLLSHSAPMWTGCLPPPACGHPSRSHRGHPSAPSLPSPMLSHLCGVHPLVTSDSLGDTFSRIRYV